MNPTMIQSWPLYEAMLYSHWVVYFVGLILMFKYGHPIAGGFIMLLAALMPLTGQAWFTDSEAPGLAFLLFIEGPPAAIVFIVGLAIGLSRFYTNGSRF